MDELDATSTPASDIVKYDAGGDDALVKLGFDKSLYDSVKSDEGGDEAMVKPEPLKTFDKSLYGLVKGKPTYKAYPCAICGRRFLWRSDCRKHERVHTGEKPYKCDTCGRGFTQSQHMQAHRFRCVYGPFKHLQ